VSFIIEVLPEAGPALVVGGGAVATRKVRNLAEGQFRITVIAPVISEEIRLAPWVTPIEREFQDSDISIEPPFALVFACSDSREVNRRVGVLARAARIPVVVTDAQDESTFFTPAVVRDGEVTIAVSTRGASPILAREIREAIVTVLKSGPRLAKFALAAREERQGRLARERAGPGDPGEGVQREALRRAFRRHDLPEYRPRKPGDD
jgi:siroheme synthase-like protein